MIEVREVVFYRYFLLHYDVLFARAFILLAVSGLIDISMTTARAQKARENKWEKEKAKIQEGKRKKYG